MLRNNKIGKESEASKEKDFTLKPLEILFFNEISVIIVIINSCIHPTVITVKKRNHTTYPVSAENEGLAIA